MILPYLIMRQIQVEGDMKVGYTNTSGVLTSIKQTQGTIAKADILRCHSDNDILKNALHYGFNPFIPFHVVKVPKVKYRLEFPLGEKESWGEFFRIADMCSKREITGNSAIDTLHACFSSVSTEDEEWMRKILKKNLGLGIGTKTVNKVFADLIPTFEVSLAQKFEEKRIALMPEVYVEPKLDGIRCFAIVENNEAKLFARSGKLITNFDNTIGIALASLGDGCYDGELMGKDFIALMRQAYRKENVEQEGTYIALFDFLPIEEWKSNKTVMITKDRYHELNLRVTRCLKSKYVKIVERCLVGADYNKIMKLHNTFVGEGYEGAMVKTVDSPYRFGRSYDIMKVKEFHDVDLAIEGMDEGTGRHKGRLGAVIINYKGTKVKVGSGFTDELRELVWDNQAGFIGRVIEVRYQEVTPDGSLRFPTFVCFRNDR